MIFILLSFYLSRLVKNYVEQFCSENCRHQAWDQYNQVRHHITR